MKNGKGKKSDKKRRKTGKHGNEEKEAPKRVILGTKPLLGENQRIN